jgi:hypothetical protein
MSRAAKRAHLLLRVARDCDCGVRLRGDLTRAGLGYVYNCIHGKPLPTSRTYQRTNGSDGFSCGNTVRRTGRLVRQQLLALLVLNMFRRRDGNLKMDSGPDRWP